MYSRFPLAVEVMMWVLSAACLIGAVIVAPARDQDPLLFWIVAAFAGWQSLEMARARSYRKDEDEPGLQAETM